MAAIFNCILLYKNVWISIKISRKFVPKARINNIPALIQIMARQVSDLILKTAGAKLHGDNLSLTITV